MWDIATLISNIPREESSQGKQSASRDKPYKRAPFIIAL